MEDPYKDLRQFIQNTSTRRMKSLTRFPDFLNSSNIITNKSIYISNCK